jgi:1,4-dihydroxy-2-naphthoate polyprenyltransferase
VTILAAALVLLAAGIPLIAQLRTLDADRAAGRRTLVTLIGATAARVSYSVLVVAAFALLPLAWALGAIPTGGLTPLLSAPLAVRLGDVVSHRAGPALGPALRDGVVLVVLFAVLYEVGVALVPG